METPQDPQGPPRTETPAADGKSDLKIVLQFFIVPLSLVAVLVSAFFGLQVLRSRRPDAEGALRSLQRYDGLLARWVGDVKRWQSGYDLSLLMRAGDGEAIRRALPQLTAAFRDARERGDDRLRRYLALALGRAADPAAIAPLREGLKDADAPTRLYSCWGLMLIGDPSALDDLRVAAGDSDPGVRKAAVFALGRLKDRGALPLLRAALADPIVDVRWNAALAMARLGDAAAVPTLVELLDQSRDASTPAESALRRERGVNAVRGLALLGTPEARHALTRAAAAAADPRVKEAARQALDEPGAKAESQSP